MQALRHCILLISAVDLDRIGVLIECNRIEQKKEKIVRKFLLKKG
jgi:hypothetical protein